MPRRSKVLSGTLVASALLLTSIGIGLELQEALPVWRDEPQLVAAGARVPEVAQVPPGPCPDPTNTIGAAAPVRTLPMNPIG